MRFCSHWWVAINFLFLRAAGIAAGSVRKHWGANFAVTAKLKVDFFYSKYKAFGVVYGVFARDGFGQYLCFVVC